MNKEKTNIIYLLGAGRSGTTMLTTVLNNHPKIYAVGEMHQFLDYVKDNKDCSCGADLSDCVFWSQILEELDTKKIGNEAVVNFSNRLEEHFNIPKHLILKNPNKKYSEIVNDIFGVIANKVSEPWLLDSSKFISRYLLIRKNQNFRVKGIYMVRDVRGVVHSFGKNVQTPKRPFSAILYYVMINVFGQIVSLIDRRVLRIRYEDFVENPDATLQKLERHIFEETEKLTNLETATFEIPHIIAGNRLRSQKKLVIKQDIVWKDKIGRAKQVLYYFLAFPIMLLNRYKP